jgi:N-acetylglucosamine-6-phosphate deacetylase
MAKISAWEAKNGITTICPAFLTLPLDTLVKAARQSANLFDRQPDQACFVGVNLEGPFVSKDKLGAQNPKYAIDPNAQVIEEIQQIVPIKLLDLAPELPGAIELIKKYHQQINFSIAHTTANFATATSAFTAGANHITHLFNAMPPLSHKDPSVVGAAYKFRQQVYPELITDSIHIHPQVVKMSFDIFDNLTLVSDSMKATGLGDCTSEIGGQKVIVKNKEARLATNGALAGSAFNLFDCFYNAVNKIGIKLEKAVVAATLNPAKSIGVDGQYGSIENNKIANILILDQNLQLEQVILGGKEL